MRHLDPEESGTGIHICMNCEKGPGSLLEGSRNFLIQGIGSKFLCYDCYMIFKNKVDDFMSSGAYDDVMLTAKEARSLGLPENIGKASKKIHAKYVPKKDCAESNRNKDWSESS